MSKAMLIASLFPIPVGSCKLGRDPCEAELAWVGSLRKRDNGGHSTSSDSRVLDDANLADIRAFIEGSLASFFEEVYNPRAEVRLRITQSWCNDSPQGDVHQRHAHANSFLSGVFYFCSDPLHDSLRFFRQDQLAYKCPPRAWNHWIADSSWFAVAPGDLLIFPSCLPHQVDSIQAEKTQAEKTAGSRGGKGGRQRISLAFNSFPVGELGGEDELTLLHLGA